MALHDHFSRQAAAYRAARPCYPRELFAFLAAQAPGPELAWDVGTGNGQAAVALADVMAAVIATDISREQLAEAEPHPRIFYRQAPAEASDLPERCMDLITVAQALHWFDREAFFAAARQILKPAGVLAVWTYDLVSVEPQIDGYVQAFYHDTVGPFWPAERRLVEERYASVALPYSELQVPSFELVADWPLERFTTYLRSWSASQRYLEQHGEDPVGSLAERLGDLWGTESRRLVWPLTVRACRRPA